MASELILIPAYRPCDILLETVRALLRPEVVAIVIVDDGSGPEFRPLFDSLAENPKVRIIRHAVNLGKGAALRSGLNYILAEFPTCEGMVTADADGQHHPEDIHKVGACLKEHPETLVMGVRTFDSNTPLRSRFGNQITRCLFRLVHGTSLSDTQTGLRGIPRGFAERLLRLESRGYEFELDMLILARRLEVPIAEVPIRTIYLSGNASSHFNPLLDSMRIYFVLLRFAASSVVTAIVDNLIFYLAYSLRPEAVIAQIVARSVALVVNYRLNRDVVFLTRRPGNSVWLRYVGLVIVSGAVSLAIMRSLQYAFGIPIIAAKMIGETFLFLFNFAFLRDFVFTNSSAERTTTNWSEYYKSVAPVARLTRKYTTGTILEAVDASGFDAKAGDAAILEFGGGNSWFLDALVDRFRPREYHVADTNSDGLDLLRDRAIAGAKLCLHKADVLYDTIPGQFDLVFSIGLVEHFDADGTAKSILAHFDHVKPGGIVLISFPCQTMLYRATRALLEAVGRWQFPDERPLEAEEVLKAVRGRGTVLFEKTLWPLILTQHMILARKPL